MRIVVKTSFIISN